MNNNDLRYNDENENSIPPMSENEVPPGYDPDRMFSESYEDDRPESPVKMYVTPAKTRFLSVAAFILCCAGIIISMLIFFFQVWEELIGFMGFNVNPRTMIAGAIIIALGAFTIYYIIHVLMHPTNKRLNSLLLTSGFMIAIALITAASRSFIPPIKIVYVLLTAVLTVSGVMIIKKLNADEYDMTTILAGGYYICFLIFISLRVLFATVYYPGMDFSTKMFYIQSEDISCLSDPSRAVYEPLLSESNGGFGPLSWEVDHRNTSFENETGVDNYFDKLASDHAGQYKDYPKLERIDKQIRSLLEPELQKYDDEFFKDHVVWLIPMDYDYCIKSIDPDFIYIPQTTSRMNIQAKENRINDDHYCGICYMMIEMDRSKAKNIVAQSINVYSVHQYAY